MSKEEQTYYYAIVYFKHQEMSCAGPFESYDKMMQALKKGVLKHPEMIKSTSYITRKEKMSLETIFGHPKSRDIMQDKKFLSEITL